MAEELAKIDTQGMSGPTDPNYKGKKKKPFMPSLTTSLHPGTSEASMGLPTADASNSDLGKPSR